MADKQKEKQLRLQRRKWSVRNSLAGTPERPRLAVFRSDKHIYAQLIDDLAGRTLASAASTSGEVRGELKNGGNGALRHPPSDVRRRVLVRPGAERVPQLLLQGTGGGEGAALRVVDDLGVDVAARAEHGQPHAPAALDPEPVAEPPAPALLRF